MPDPTAARSDIDAISRITAVPTILRTITELTGLRFTVVARVTRDSWTACAVHDEIDFGLRPGGTLEVTTTLCKEVRETQRPIVIDHASEDPMFCGHPAPKQYGFESYVSVPLFRKDGQYFGTLCGLDPAPRALRAGRTVTTLELFAELISVQLEVQLEADDRLARSQSALAEAQSTAELREQFIAVLGHDVRNPLNAISLGAAVLLGHDLPADARSIVERMRRSARRIDGLVADVLDLTRGRLGGGLQLDRREERDLEPSMRHVVDEIASAHPGRTIELTFADPGPVSCDRQRIEQVVSNLLSNALEHGAPERPVALDVRAAGDAMVLTVRNGGEPIPAETLPRLFQPFYRHHQGADRGGLGLGLFIVSEIARAHGGTVSATSSRDDGTVFTFSIPRAPRPD